MFKFDLLWFWVKRLSAIQAEGDEVTDTRIKNLRYYVGISGRLSILSHLTRCLRGIWRAIPSIFWDICRFKSVHFAARSGFGLF